MRTSRNGREGRSLFQRHAHLLHGLLRLHAGHHLKLHLRRSRQLLGEYLVLFEQATVVNRQHFYKEFTDASSSSAIRMRA
jgi:hypothetical protein